MGGISAGGLITGIDSNALITQLLALERGPIIRAQDRIAALETEQTAVRDLRTQLTTLRNRVQDFRLNNIFDAFTSASSEETVLTSSVSSAEPVVGAFEIDILQLASATSAQSSARLGAAIDPNAALDSSGIRTEVSTGTFTINGVAFNVDPATDSLNDIVNDINTSSAGVTASYDALTDKVTLENTAASDTSIINLGADGDDSNFLEAIAVEQATQFTNGSGSTELTGTRNLGAVDSNEVLNTQDFENGAITAGTFSINGVSITVDPTTDSLGDIISLINGSDAGVTASYDSSADVLRFTSDTLGSRTIKFGGAGDTSNFLAVTNLDTATQTAGKDSEFTVNGGPTQTRNTNEVSDAITGVTVNLLSTGVSTVSVASDNDTIIEEITEFIDAFNASVGQIRDLTNSDGTLSGDSGIRSIQTFLRDRIFQQVSGIGDFDSLLAIGITSGEDFDISTAGQIELDEDRLREALSEDRQNVQQLFANDDETGIADLLFDYLDDVTGISGFLNARAKENGTIDLQIRNLDDRIARIEDRLVLKEERLRRQFTQLEQLSAGFQNQSAALSRIGAGVSLF